MPGDPRGLIAALKSAGAASEGGQAHALQLRRQLADESAAREEARQRQAEEADKVVRSVKKQILGKGLESLAKMQGADRVRSEYALSRLMVDLGIDPSTHAAIFASVPSVNETQKELEKRAIGVASPESVIESAQTGAGIGGLRAPAQGKKFRTVSPGSAVFSEDSGKVVFKNPAKPKEKGYKQIVLEDAKKGYEELKEELKDDPRLSSRLRLAMKRIDVQAAGPGMGVGEARILRSHLMESYEAIRKFDNAAADVYQILDRAPAAATIGGDAAGAIVSMTSNIKGLTALISDVDPDFSVEEGSYAEQLESLNIDNAELRSALFSIALQEAVVSGLANGRLSNQQVELAIKNVGANARNPQQIKAKLVEVNQRLRHALDSRLDFVLGNYGAIDKSAVPDEEYESLKGMAVEDMTEDQVKRLFQLMRERGEIGG